MRKAAAELDFEKAAGLRDEVAHLRDLLLRAGEAPDAIGTGS